MNDPVSQFFDAVERQDWGALAPLCAPDFAVWQNLTDRSRDLDGVVRFLQRVVETYGALHYTDRRRYDAPGAVTVQQTIGYADRGLTVPACMVCTLAADGRLARIDEYMDSRAFA